MDLAVQAEETNKVAYNPKQRIMSPFDLMVSKYDDSQDLINTLTKMNVRSLLNFPMWKKHSHFHFPIL